MKQGPKQDIEDKSDIEKVIQLFYEKVKEDNSLNYFFSEVVKVDWAKHEKRMTAFWENVLFYTGDYEGNPLVAHRKVNQIQSTNAQHFESWLKLFDDSLDQLFKGPHVEKMKSHAKAIASVMQQKIQ